MGPFLHAFASGFLLSLSVCLDLGLVNLAILRTALRDGARPALLIGLGSCFGDLIYFALSALGINAMLSFTPVRWVLWLGGTAVLIYFTVKMLREVARPHPLDLRAPPPAAAGSLARHLSLGLSLALASPTAILWFAAVGGSVIASFAGRQHVLFPFVSGFFTAGVAWSVAAAFGGALLGRSTGPKVVRVLSAASAILFAYFAVVVFLDGLRTLR